MSPDDRSRPGHYSRPAPEAISHHADAAATMALRARDGVASAALVGRRVARHSRNGSGAHLQDEHRRELFAQSAIDPEVVAERGYETIRRPSVADDRPRRRLARLGIPSWAIGEDAYYYSRTSGEAPRAS